MSGLTKPPELELSNGVASIRTLDLSDSHHLQDLAAEAVMATSRSFVLLGDANVSLAVFWSTLFTVGVAAVKESLTAWLETLPVEYPHPLKPADIAKLMHYLMDTHPDVLAFFLTSKKIPQTMVGKFIAERMLSHHWQDSST